jgi:hypothetical protein
MYSISASQFGLICIVHVYKTTSNIPNEQKGGQRASLTMHPQTFKILFGFYVHEIIVNGSRSYVLYV